MASEPNNHDIAMESVSSPAIIDTSTSTSGALNTQQSHEIANGAAGHNAPQQIQHIAMQPLQATNAQQTSPIIGTPEATKEFDMELWANSLVGRWWEIFWEPNEENDAEEDTHNAPVKGEGDGQGSSGYQVNNTTQGVVMSIRGGGVDDDDDAGENNSGAVVKIEEDTTNQSANNTPNTTAAGHPQQQQQQQQQYQNQGGYSNSFGFDTSTWGNENIRLQNGSSRVSLSITSLIVVGCVYVLTLIWL